MEVCLSCYGDGHCRSCTGSGYESAGRACPNCGGRGKCLECDGIQRRVTPEQLAPTSFQPQEEARDWTEY